MNPSNSTTTNQRHRRRWKCKCQERGCMRAPRTRQFCRLSGEPYDRGRPPSLPSFPLTLTTSQQGGAASPAQQREADHVRLCFAAVNLSSVCGYKYHTSPPRKRCPGRWLCCHWERTRYSRLTYAAVSLLPPSFPPTVILTTCLRCSVLSPRLSTRLILSDRSFSVQTVVVCVHRSRAVGYPEEVRDNSPQPPVCCGLATQHCGVTHRGETIEGRANGQRRAASVRDD
jgi:hypothetical protein